MSSRIRDAIKKQLEVGSSGADAAAGIKISELAKSFGGLTTKPQPAQDISGAASRKQAVPIAISCPDHDCPPSLDEQNLDEAALLCSTIGGSTISPSIFNLETLGTKLIDKLGSSMKTTVLSRIALRIVFLLMEVATLGCFTRSMPTEKYEQAGSTIDVLRRRIFTAAEQQVSSGVKESDIFPQWSSIHAVAGSAALIIGQLIATFLNFLLQVTNLGFGPLNRVDAKSWLELCCKRCKGNLFL